MNDNNEESRKQSHMIQSPTVMKQQNELESQSLKTDIKSKKVVPMRFRRWKQKMGSPSKSSRGILHTQILRLPQQL
ncbi:hypothetical protein ATW55_09555 [Ferroacidibacillus organovorans]|uniref:Uncharacterized protein n=1 Tax=Ferroacidibacillus organovorans TaxID=1765683 RepID=A0A117SXK4_9BACL|nr:hypothetical protein ATW55_09555 [Ferroacidibacillus organovorans]